MAMAGGGVDFQMSNQPKQEIHDDVEEEEEESELKYVRLAFDAKGILKKEAASCMAIHPKFVALGTHYGAVYVLDHLGNNIEGAALKESHSTSINQLSIDDNGDFIASCSDDGKMVIHEICSQTAVQTMTFDRPVKAVALDPNYGRSDSRKQFITGDDKLILNERSGILKRHRSTVLHQGEGFIRNIKWRGNFVAWANDEGVKIYDMVIKERFTFIAKDYNPQIRPELYRCNLCWSTDTTLLIGWGDCVKVCCVKSRVSHDARNLPNKYVEITSMFKLDYYICGISAFHNESKLCVLSFDTKKTDAESPAAKQNEKGDAPRPHFRIIQPFSDFGSELSNDVLGIKEYGNYRCYDYQLEYLGEENKFFVISPRDIVVANQRTENDHLEWLVQHNKFQEALDVTRGRDGLTDPSYSEIGHKFLEYLMKRGRYPEAAYQCGELLTVAVSAKVWENYFYKFHNAKRAMDLAPYLPTRRKPTLSKAIYELVLYHFLQADVKGLQKLLYEWPAEIYDIQVIVNAICKHYVLAEEILADESYVTLNECLVHAYTLQENYEGALNIYLRLGRKDCFSFIRDHRLVENIYDKILLLMELDADQTVGLLLEYRDSIPPEKVVRQLEYHPKSKHTYLHHLFRRDPMLSRPWHDEQVMLYAEYDSEAALLHFLQNKHAQFDQMAALHVCERKGIVKGKIYLLARTGNLKQALKLITTEVKDEEYAIEFCKEHNDGELWTDLIDFSIDKPKLVKALLHNIGTHVDPIILIKKIREGMQIDGLRDALVKILQDYDLQTSLRVDCQKILVSDCFVLLQRLVALRNKGVPVNDDQSCSFCQDKIIHYDLPSALNVRVYYCSHAFHEDCLPLSHLDYCPICTAQGQRVRQVAWG